MTAPVPSDTPGLWSSTPMGLLTTAPGLPTVYLTDDEQTLVSRLTAAIESNRYGLQIKDAYYRGENHLADLGISIPPQMRMLRVAIGWPRVCVEALDERLDIEGFMYPGSSDVDQQLQDIWVASDMDSESQLANLDALVFGRGIAAVGSGETGPNTIDTPPIITVESPLDMAVLWNARLRSVVAALRIYDCEGSIQGTLYTPNQNVSLLKTAGGWDVLDRDVHNLGQCAITRITNRPRTYDRDGQSQITTEVMNITDAACRKLLGIEIASEFYSAPQRYILGAAESAFQNPDGTAKSSWDTYLGRIVALERDEEGEVPTVGQFQAYEPGAYTKVIDTYAKIISSITGLPPHVLGYSTDNPASADAIRSSESRLTLMADRKTRMFGSAWRQVMKLALTIQGGPLPPKIDQLQTVWASTATPTPAATTDSIVKQIQSGMIPPTSDVTLEAAGWNAAQRERLAVDRESDAGDAFLAELAHSTIAKEAKVDQGLAVDLDTPPAPIVPGSAAATDS